ncbi:uncharacterized protein LOC133834347 [Humulus lupulus]|uniref:uncharacterized protein LOC133834347 n=1 Tax=Humulus lupulus TaxID=3486 RepID=UPI002B40E75B|nr:uncharacterized protein LOC133834347 [Humulus lupulus]
MDSENVFDMYYAPEAPEAHASKRKSSKRHQGESSKAPPAKKSRTADPLTDGPSTNATPPPPLEQQTPPAPVGSTPSPPAPTDQTQQATPTSTGGDLLSRALRSAKDRIAKILKHEHYREAMAMLTVTASQLRSGAITEQSRNFEQRHAEELKAAEAKYVEQLEAAQKTNAALLEVKNKLAEELREKQTALDKEANFSYILERTRHAEIAQRVARLAEEERARILASPEISLAAGVE